MSTWKPTTASLPAWKAEPRSLNVLAKLTLRNWKPRPWRACKHGKLCHISSSTFHLHAPLLRSDLQQALARLDAVETMAGSAGTQEELLALQEALAKLEAAEAASAAKAAKLEAEVAADFEDVRGALAGKASVEASDRKMDRATCEALLRDLNRHVQARATVDEMREACGRLDQHQAAQRLLQEKVEVALAFVEWFGAKGETYEYNAAAMERHMNALARGNRASVRGVARAAPPRA